MWRLKNLPTKCWETPDWINPLSSFIFPSTCDNHTWFSPLPHSGHREDISLPKLWTSILLTPPSWFPEDMSKLMGFPWCSSNCIQTLHKWWIYFTTYLLPRNRDGRKWKKFSTGFAAQIEMNILFLKNLIFDILKDKCRHETLWL